MNCFENLPWRFDGIGKTNDKIMEERKIWKMEDI